MEAAEAPLDNHRHSLFKPTYRTRKSSGVQGYSLQPFYNGSHSDSATCCLFYFQVHQWGPSSWTRILWVMEIVILPDMRQMQKQMVVFFTNSTKLNSSAGYLESSPLMPPLTFSTLSPRASAVACTLKKKTDGIMFLSV